jgi:RNA polymerase sigma-70 factor (ECF subfamily)
MSAPVLADPPAAAAPASFEEAYRGYAQCTARWARNLGGADIEVEDVVQEVFLVVSRRLRDFRGQARFSSWLFEITRKTVANHRRRHRWRFWIGRGDSADQRATPADDPDSQLERRQAADLFYRALDRLREPYRTVLVLFEVEGMSTQAIAELCGTKVATVKVQLFRARERFIAHYQHLLSEGKS